MDTDGQQTGYDLKLLRAISESVTIPLIASGGAGEPQHLYDALAEGKADAVLAASIFHYGTYPIPIVKKVPIRQRRSDKTVSWLRLPHKSLP